MNELTPVQIYRLCPVKITLYGAIAFAPIAGCITATFTPIGDAFLYRIITALLTICLVFLIGFASAYAIMNVTD